MPYTTLSSHCEETLKADSKAFAMLMRHIKEVDEKEQTVVMIQVENEPGLQGRAREHSDYADALFNTEVPYEFAEYMRNSTAEMNTDIKNEVENGKQFGTWEEVFGKAAEEIFHTYAVSKYGTKDLQAVISERSKQDVLAFEQYGFKIIMNSPMNTRKDGVCLALKVADNKFYLIANGCMIMPFAVNPETPNVDILSLEEGEIQNGRWHMICRLNGDEEAAMHYDKPTVLKMKLFAYE